jgi:hypothetical protein
MHNYIELTTCQFPLRLKEFQENTRNINPILLMDIIFNICIIILKAKRDTYFKY